jgi:hypothetical protein
MKPTKPLNGKAYGSIPHLPGSRLGEGDHHVSQGQSDICQVKPRKGDRIIVQEKLDGACMSIANINGELVALSRAGYMAKNALYEHLKIFEDWVRWNEYNFDFLRPGERLVGEWLAMAHGTIYEHTDPYFSPFVAFDIVREKERVPYDEFKHKINFRNKIAAVIYDSEKPVTIEQAMTALSEYGYHCSTELVEGAVWRVENKGVVDFLAKYVRHDKIDGKYLPNISGNDPIWMWRPEWEK